MQVKVVIHALSQLHGTNETNPHNQNAQQQDYTLHLTVLSH